MFIVKIFPGFCLCERGVSVEGFAQIDKGTLEERAGSHQSACVNNPWERIVQPVKSIFMIAVNLVLFGTLQSFGGNGFLYPFDKGLLLLIYKALDRRQVIL
jgi:hypothetical protein